MNHGIPTLSCLILLSISPLLRGQDRDMELQFYYQTAREALAEGDLGKAVDAYAQILELQPNNVEILQARGAALYSLKRFDEAIQTLNRALQLSPSSAVVEAFLGLSLASVGKQAQAIPHLEAALIGQLKPGVLRLVGLTLVDSYQVERKFEQAADLLRSLRHKFPDDESVLYAEVQVYSQLWNRSLTNLLNTHPGSYRVHQLAGEILVQRGKYEAAEKEYRKALQKNPKALGIRFSLGKLILANKADQRREERAAREFESELQLDPNNAQAEFEIAKMAWRRRDLEEAEKHLDRALSIKPDFVDVLVVLGQLDQVRGNPQKALERLTQAVELDAENSKAHYQLMLVYRDVGMTEQAQQQFTIFQRLQQQEQEAEAARLRSLLGLTEESPNIAP